MTVSWHLLCKNPLAIEAYYESVPTLDDFDVHEISLRRDGPLLTFAGDLARFADHPSQRWDSTANRVRLILSLWGVSELTLRGWDTTNHGSLSIAPGPSSGLTFSFAGPTIECSGVCDFAMIAKITAYKNSEG